MPWCIRASDSAASPNSQDEHPAHSNMPVQQAHVDRFFDLSDRSQEPTNTSLGKRGILWAFSETYLHLDQPESNVSTNVWLSVLSASLRKHAMLVGPQDSGLKAQVAIVIGKMSRKDHCYEPVNQSKKRKAKIQVL